MSAHTPGPWLYRGKSDSVHASSETHPYGEYLFAFQEECAPNDADLALILAAPELLEALVNMVEWHGKRKLPTRGSKVESLLPIDQQNDEVRLAMRAIAKATGGAA